MSTFCSQCGNKIENGTAFCTECGTKITPPAAQPQGGSPIQEQPVQPVETPAAQPQPQEQPPVVPQPQVQPQPKVAPQPQVQAQPQPYITSENKVVGTGAFFWLMLLFALPVIGLIACLVMAFAPKNKNLKHFARAVLIWMIVGIVCTGLLVGSLYLFADNVWDSFTNTLGESYFTQQEKQEFNNNDQYEHNINADEHSQIQEEEAHEGFGVFGDLFEGLGDLSDVMNDMEGLTTAPNE